jgi:MFS family permease
VSLVLGGFASGLEQMIVATATPTITEHLGGLTRYTWIFSGFLLTQSVSTIIFGKLADVYGRKPILILGMTLVLLGSIFSGFAWSMSSLIAFRMLQGLGAGATTPVTATVMGDLFGLEQRARVLGVMGTTFVVGSVVGPLVGSLVISHLSWRWVFWLGIPPSAVAIGGLALFLQESGKVRHHKIDAVGAALLCVSTTSLLLLLAQTKFAPVTLITLTTLFITSSVIFVQHEWHVPEPIIPLEIWNYSPIATANVAALVACMTLTAFTTVMPLYVQGVLLQSPLRAGIALTGLSVGSVLAFALSGRANRVWGMRRTLRGSAIVVAVGAVLLLTAGPHSTPVLADAAAFLIGFGHGPLNVLGLAFVQDRVAESRRGSVTASFSFATSLGYTLGATIAGALFNLGIAHYEGSGNFVSTQSLLELPQGFLQMLSDPGARSTFEHALHWSFLGVVISAILLVAVVWLIPIPNSRGTNGSKMRSLRSKHGVCSN